MSSDVEPYLSPEPQKSGAPESREKLRESVFAALLISFGVCGLRLVYRADLWNQLIETNRRVGIGTVQKERGGVRHRSTESPLWRDLSDQALSVANGDTLFTGADGRAEVKLSDGTVAKIQSNSLIVIKLQKAEKSTGSWLRRFIGAKPVQESAIQVKKGRVKIQITPEVRSVALEVGAKKFELKSEAPSAEIEVSVEQGLSISSTQDIVVQDVLKKEPERVEKNKVLEVEQAVLMTPTVPEVVIEKEPEPEKTEAVAPPPPAEAAPAPVATEAVAPAPSLAPLAALPEAVPPAPPQAAAPAPVVEEPKAEPKPVPPPKPAVTYLDAPVAKFPVEGVDAVLNTPVLFTWTKSPGAALYHLQVSGNPKFEGNQVDLKKKQNYHDGYSPSAPGVFYWRVRALGDSEKSKWTETRSFTVN